MILNRLQYVNGTLYNGMTPREESIPYHFAGKLAKHLPGAKSKKLKMKGGPSWKR